MPFKNQHPLYVVWRSMLDRCYNPKMKQYRDYGGRGIKVCPQWKYDYKQFIIDMEPRPAGMTLDRIDNDKDYSPENCKWSTRKDQQRNQRVTRKVIIEGKTYIAADLADIHGLKTDTVVERAKKGLSYDEIISGDRRVIYNPEALARGAALSASNRRARTHCKYGHEYTEENTYIGTEGKYSFRCCRQCHVDKENKRNMLKRLGKKLAKRAMSKGILASPNY